MDFPGPWQQHKAHSDQGQGYSSDSGYTPNREPLPWVVWVIMAFLFFCMLMGL